MAIMLPFSHVPYIIEDRRFSQLLHMNDIAPEKEENQGHTLQ